MANKFDQAKMAMQMKKIQHELQKQVISIEKGEGAVRVDISADQKIKKIHLDTEQIDLEDIGQTEKWLEEAVRDAISASQKAAQEKMQPMMGALGDLGF
jgi:DNA-binding protein YbaB